MKKYLSLILATLIAFGIGFYFGYNDSNENQKENSANVPTSKQSDITPSDSQKDIERLKNSLQKEKRNSNKLQQELQEQKSKVAQLEQFVTESAPLPEEEIIPATGYERTAFVTNLIHQFNADNSSTEIVDIDCQNDFCFLTANVSAGTSTNPEIANLMRFLDEQRLPAYYQRVELLNVSKESDHSKVKLSLNM